MVKRILTLFLVLLLAALACNVPTSNPTTSGAEPATSTSTSVSTSNSAPETAPPAQPVETATGVPTATSPSLPSPTATSGVPCNLAEFVADVTIPDGTQMVFDKTFSKTWRLKNAGSCTWTSGYQLVFDSGDQMGGPSSQQLTSSTVAPGQTLDVTVNLKAPGSAGTYRGNWKIRDQGGELFGLAGGPFWVEIQAVPTYQVVLPNWPNFKAGATGKEVSAIQYLLNYHGKNLSVDGVFGPQTTSAVKSFQSQNGLSADGIVGPNTWVALIQGAQVGQGKKGDAVRAAQTLLNKFGAGLNVDGVFGPQTVTAVKNFQSGHGLAADGIVGPNTWQALVGY